MLIPKRRGRPLLLTDDALLQRRAFLVGTFDVQWTDFAWELQRAKSARAIRNALQPIHKRTGLEPFVYEPTRSSTWTELRTHRHTLDRRSRHITVAAEDELAAKNRLDKVEGALLDVGSDETLERACVKRKADYAAAAGLSRHLQESMVELREELRRREAHVSQAELLEFIASKRYTITPITLANAMAGLPFISWRHSAARCNELAVEVAVGLSYQMFQDLKRVLADPPPTKREAVEKVKAYLVGKKRPIPASVREFRAHWHYLRTSIEAVYDTRPPKTALPYRVSTEYRRRSSSRSRYDQVLEEEERI